MHESAYAQLFFQHDRFDNNGFFSLQVIMTQLYMCVFVMHGQNASCAVSDFA